MTFFDAIFSIHIRAQIALRPSNSVIFTPKFSKAPLVTRGGTGAHAPVMH